MLIFTEIDYYKDPRSTQIEQKRLRLNQLVYQILKVSHKYGKFSQLLWITW